MNQDIQDQQLEDSRTFYENAVPHSVEEVNMMESICAEFRNFDEKIIEMVPQGAKRDEARALLKQACEASVESVIENWQPPDATPEPDTPPEE